MQLQFKSSKFTFVTRGGGKSITLSVIFYGKLYICITLNDCEVKGLLVRALKKKKNMLFKSQDIFISIEINTIRVFNESSSKKE